MTGPFTMLGTDDAAVCDGDACEMPVAVDQSAPG